LIISDKRDISAHEVAEWIRFFGGEAFLMSTKEILKSVKFSFSSTKCHFLSRFYSGWYRRDVIYDENVICDKLEEKHRHKMLKRVDDDLNQLRNYVFSERYVDKWLSNHSLKYLDKLSVLESARFFGIKTPEFIVTNNRNCLVEFEKNVGPLIVKPISNNISIIENEFQLIQRVNFVKNISNSFPLNFMPAFFQQYIDKLFEIRTFYLDGSFYSTSLLSNNEVDIKSVLTTCRQVPYKLNSDYQEKLENLLKHLNIKTASIDSLVSKNGEIYFLELNVNGQFGWISKGCNYYLEREIAKYLLR